MTHRVFIADKDGNILLTPIQLKRMLDEAYLEGRRTNNSLCEYAPPIFGNSYHVTCEETFCEIRSIN